MTSLVLAPPPRLSAHDRGPQFQAALREVGVYLATAHLTDRYGVQLLHGHFPLAHEAVVQTIKDNVQSTRVVQRDEADGLAPAIWGIAPDGTPVPMQWTEDAAASIVDPDLEAFAHFLAAARFASTFAVVDLSHLIRLGPNEVALEQTDESRRTQRTAAVPHSSVSEGQVACWSFTIDGKPVPRHFCNGVDHHNS